MKHLKIYFKKEGTIYRLDKYPITYHLLKSNWTKIVNEYLRLNSTSEENKPIVKSLYYNTPMFTVSKERFLEVQKELKLESQSPIDFYANGDKNRILSLNAER